MYNITDKYGNPYTYKLDMERPTYFILSNGDIFPTEMLVFMNKNTHEFSYYLEKNSEIVDNIISAYLPEDIPDETPVPEGAMESLFKPIEIVTFENNPLKLIKDILISFLSLKHTTILKETDLRDIERDLVDNINTVINVNPMDIGAELPIIRINLGDDDDVELLLGGEYDETGKKYRNLYYFEEEQNTFKIYGKAYGADSKSGKMILFTVN